jgi:peptide/nickel transport system permease protein
MLAMIARRMLSAIPVLILISIIAFGLQSLAPGDPARMLVEASGQTPAPPEAITAKRDELRLDDPVIARYLAWITDAVRGDLGRSYRSYEPVTSLYLDRLGATVMLALAGGLISAGVGIPLGMIAAWRHGTLLDRFSRSIVLIGAAIPGFWIALVLMLIFSVHLGWFPAFGSPTPSGIVLPAIVIALPGIAVLTRLARAATLDAMNNDYVTVARMKGQRERTILLRHVAPNASTAVITVFGLELAGLLTGAAVVEYVFAWPGIGKLAIDAVLLRDIPVVIGFAVIAGIIFLCINLLADIAIRLIDPRIQGS